VAHVIMCRVDRFDASMPIQHSLVCALCVLFSEEPIVHEESGCEPNKRGVVLV
jgi:hypothetical protein